MANAVYSETHKFETLNLFFHGTFVFLDIKGEDKIRAVIPKINDHVYRAGNWLGETELKAGTYELQGVETGKDSFDDSRNLVLCSPEWRINGAFAHATLILPRPDTITSLRVAKIPIGSLANTGELKLSAHGGTQIATVQIFAYRFRNDASVFLETAGAPNNGQGESSGHYWEPVCSADSFNLHVFSAEDHFQGPSYAAGDFQACMDVLGSALKLKRPHSANGIREDETLPAGVSAEETEDLAPRTLRLARLGRLVREQGDLNQAWYRNDALDEDPPACGGPVGKDG